MDKKKKELEVLEKEVRKLCNLRAKAEHRIKASTKYQRLEKMVGQARKKRDRLREERSKLWKKTRKRFISGEIDYPTYTRNANAFYGGDTNILPKVLREIKKVAPLSKLTTSQIEEIVNLLIMREEDNTPKLAKVKREIAKIDKEQSLTWDKQDELVQGVDTFSSKIEKLKAKINSLEEERKYPGRIKAREEKEAARILVFDNIDKIYEALTKKKRG